MTFGLILAATVSIGKIVLPTYPYLDEDPVPATDKSYWPYARFDGTSAESVSQAWDCVTLESDRLKVTMLPEVGGKVWGAIDKRTGREFIYFNHAVKFRDIAMCGPWCSGGIEFNFGIVGHSPTTASPIAWTTRENADGSVSYFCGNTERICGTTWQVEVRLRDGDDHFTTRTQWFNSSELDEPYYQWMTAAYTARGNPELHYPGTHRIGHNGTAQPWPFDKTGRDLSTYGGNAFGGAKSYHIVGGDERFFGIWWPEANFGSYHECDSGEKYGRKIFMWAQSRAGAIWEDLLTDTDGQYVELQSGRVFNQPQSTTWRTPFKHPTFTPGRTDVFEERWGVLRDRSRLDEHEKRENRTERPVESPADFDWTTAYALALRADQALRESRDVRTARDFVRQALAKDPNLPPALELAAEVAYRRMEYAEARAFAAKALAVNAYSPKANYLDGLAAARLGEMATALERLGLAAYSSDYRSAAEAAMARIELKRGNLDEAGRLVAKCLEANALSIDGLRLRIELADRRGDAAAKKALTDRFAELWPAVAAVPPPAERRETCGWRGRYDRALALAAVGRDAEAAALLESCGEVEDAVFRLYRARHRQGKARLEDLLAAQRLGDSWRVGRDLAEFHRAANDFAAAEGVLADYLKRFPKRNALEILYADTLQALGRNRECVDFLKGVRILPSEFGRSATDIWKKACLALGDAEAAESYPENLGQGKPYPVTGDDRRPYEIVRANRRADEVPPVLSLVSADGWRIVCSNAEAKVATAMDRLLFGDGVLRVDYRATGKDPDVRILLAEPVVLPAFDTFSYWLYGNNFYGSDAGRKIPMADVYPLFADADGNPFELGCVWVHHREWCKFQTKVPSDLLPRTTHPGCRFLGWRIVKGTNVDFLRLDFTSVCAWKEEMKPLHYEPRAKRGVQVFPDQDQGVNVGEGRLPFPTVETTVVPQVAAEDKSIEFRFPAKDGVWDDLAFRIDGGAWIPLATGGGVWPRSAADLAKAKFHRIGDSVVADIAVKGGAVSEVRFGETELPGDVRCDPIPFLPYGAYAWDDRPCVLSARVGGTDVFVSAISDWTQGNSSEPYPPARVGARGRTANGGVRYLPKTDGVRNDVFERFVWTVSRRFEATLPEIPNPVSPWKPVTGTHAWTRSIVKGDRTANRDYYRDLLRRGITKLICTDHETMWRDGDESFTFRTNAAPQRGGNAAQLDYTRWMIETNGLYYGPYNNFTDLSPVNEYWHSDHMLRDPSGNFLESWSRCYSPKPLYGVEMCETLTPVLKRMYGFNTAYCDVHTACKPWQRTDYDFRVPGAGTFAQTFYAYGEILLLQRELWGGPVCSEGGSQCYYAGLVDQNYAQDSIYGFMEHPWILDFVLLKMHPKCCDHGPFLDMLFGGAGVPKDTWRGVDAYLAYQFAYGYSPLVLKEQKSYSYFMNLAIAARYTQADVRSIRYVGADGSLLTTSAAVRNGAIARNQSAVTYDDGTKVVVNGSTADERLAIPWENGRLDLPPMGVYAEGGETVVFAGEQGGRRVSFCRAPDYVYLCGRGSGVTCPGGATDGEVVRLKSADGSEEVVPQTDLEPWTYVELPYRAASVKGLAKDRSPCGDVPFTVTSRGWTRICRGDTEAYSFHVTSPKDFAEASVSAYRVAALAPTGRTEKKDGLRVVASDLAAVTGATELEVLFNGRSIGADSLKRTNGVVTREGRWEDWAFTSRFMPANDGKPATLELDVVNTCVRTDTLTLGFVARGKVRSSFPGDRIVLHDVGKDEKRTVVFMFE